MSFNTAPYATLNDAPKFEKRVGDVRAPWFKDQAAAKSVRVKDPLPYKTCNSKTAPYATFHNVPKPTEQSAALIEQQPQNGAHSPSKPEKKSTTPYGTSNDVIRPRTKPNLAKVHQAPWDRSDRKLDHVPVQPNVSKVHPAPWDRSDVHHKVLQPNVAKTHQAAPWERNDVHHKVVQPNVAKVHQPAPWERNDVHHKVLQPNGAKAHQAAPWERNDVHHKDVQSNVSKAPQAAPWERNDKVQPKFSRAGEVAPNHTSSSAPFATESKRG
jgi:hypothetical protein